MYTDGSSRGNPGPGGYGVVLKYKDSRKELSGGFQLTTNNRMELLAVIVGLEALKGKQQVVEIYSDSQYVIDSVQRGWLVSWLKKDFRGRKNADLWKRFWEVYQQHRVSFCWVRGHTGNVENEYCDQLATQSAQRGPLAEDRGYVDSIKSSIHEPK
jgi:ribonuclease HI